MYYIGTKLKIQLMGRPSKYKPEIAEQIIAMMKEGMSIEEVCLELNIAKQTFYNWCDKHVELLDAKKEGVDFAQGWWMKQGRIALRDKDFNATLFYMNMKNRFGWRDRQEIDHSGNVQVNVTVDNTEAKTGLGYMLGDETNPETK